MSVSLSASLSASASASASSLAPQPQLQVVPLRLVEPTPQAAALPTLPTLPTSMLLAPAELPTHSRDLLAGAARELVAAGAADESESRYAHAHLAALRAAAAVLAARARPRSKRGSRVRSAWVLLAEVAPEFAEWATFFAAGATKRAAAEAGFRGVVSPREADDLVREVESFLELVARRLGVAHQAMLIDQATGSPLSGRGFSARSVRG